MRNQLLFALFFSIICSLAKGQEKRFEGNIEIFSLEQFEAFIAEGYTHINGDFIFLKRTRGLSDVNPPLDEHPEGLNTLVEVTGDVRMDFSFFGPDLTQFKNLKSIGGQLQIINGGKIEMRRLTEIGETIDVQGSEALLPRLSRTNADAQFAANIIHLNRLTEARSLLKFTSRNSFEKQELLVPRLVKASQIETNHSDSKTVFPRLRTVEKSFISQSTLSADIEALILPQLTSIGENLLIRASGNGSGSFNKLSIPRLKTVGGDFNVTFSWHTFVAQNWPSLERVDNMIISGGAIVKADRLKEVAGDFTYTLRTNLTDQKAIISFAGLEAVRGKLTISLPGVNADRITMEEVDFPKLSFVESIDLDSDTNPMKLVKMPVLLYTNSIRADVISLELDQLKSTRFIRIWAPEEAILSIPEITQLDDLFINEGRETRIQEINLPKLESIGRISLMAKNLIYPNLKRTASTSFSWDEAEIEKADFSSLESLNQLLFRNGSYKNLDFSGLKKLNTLNILDEVSVDITTRDLDITSVSFIRFSENSSIDWDFDNTHAAILNLTEVDNGSFELPGISIGFIKIFRSALSGGVLSNLNQIGIVDIRESTFTGGSLNLSKITTADFITVLFEEPTALNLSSLTKFSDLGASDKRLNLKNVTDLNLSSLVQAGLLDFRGFANQGTHEFESIDLSSLQRVRQLWLQSDEFDEIKLGKLTILEELVFRSTSLTELSFPRLATAKRISIEGEKLTTISLPVLAEIEDLDIANTQLLSLSLASLRSAGTVTIEEHPNMASINLSGIPTMTKLEVKEMPRLKDINTFKPGEENGLITTLTSSNLFVQTETISCANGESMEQDFFPATHVLKLGCEPIEIDDKPSSRPFIEESFALIGGFGDGYTFEEDLSAPSLSVSLSASNFGELEEDTPSTTQTITLENTGGQEISGTLSLFDNDEQAFTLSQSSFALDIGQETEITITFSPEIVGNYEAKLSVNTASTSEFNLTGSKRGCIEIGGLCITAENVIRVADGEFRMSGNVTMNELLKFTGVITASTSEGSISGNGDVSISIPSGLPFAGENVLYRGQFEFNLTSEANKAFSTSLQSGANSFLRLANLPVAMEDFQFIENGIQFSASLTLPRQLKNTKVDLEEVSLTTTEGLQLAGEINVPGSIKLGGVSELSNLNFTFNTAENEFSGGATLKTKLFTMEGTVAMRKGGVDDVMVTITPNKPIPVGPTGWSLTEGTGEIRSIQTPPITLGLSVDMEPTATAGFNLVKLDDLELSYTFGTRLKGSGTLAVFDRPVAGASIEVRSRSVVLEGNINLGDFLVGDAVLAVYKTNAGLKLRGALNAKLQIPEGDSFFYQAFDGTLGLPYTVASVEARLNNTKITGSTTLLGYGLAFGVAYVDNEFVFDLAESHQLLNQEVFGNGSSGMANPNTLGSRFEGQSFKFRPQRSQANKSGYITDQTEQTFSISRELDNIFIRVQHATVKPTYTLIMPDGTEVTPENAESLGALYIESETETKQTFYAFQKPAMGEWKIMINSEDVEYNIDIAGADPEPSINFGSLEQDGEIINIPWTLDNVNDRYQINLLYDTDNENADGEEVVSTLSHNTTSHEWNTANVETGTYYLFAELEDKETGAIKVFYASEPIQIIAPGALEAPESVAVENADIEVLVTWQAVENAADYSVYFEEGQIPDNSSESFQTDELSLSLNQLDPGKNYFFSVSAWNDEGVEGPRSEAVSLNYQSTSINNSPIFEMVSDTTITATATYDISLMASDPENDPLTFEILEGPEGMSLDETSLNWTPEMDQIGPHNIVLAVLDSTGNEDEIQYLITVIQPNDPPTDISLSANSLDENQADATVGVLSATDPDANDEHSFELVAGDGDTDNANFEIDGNTLRATEAFDFESQNAAEIRVRTIDQAGQSFEKAFTIDINDVNEAPTELSLSTESIEENQAIGTLVAMMNITDPDEGDSHTYSLVVGDGSTDNAAFSISNNQLLTNAALDFESQPEYLIRLAGTDAGGLSIEKAFTITVTDGPDPAINVTPGSLIFEATALGLTTSMDLTIENTGDGPLEVSAIETPDGFAAGQQALSVAAGAEGMVSISFSPTEQKTYEGELIVRSNAGDVTAMVSGEGAIITSIDEPRLTTDQVSTYPNPASDQVTIELPAWPNADFSLMVYDRSGTNITDMTAKPGSTVQLKVSGWSPGLYLLRVSSNQGSITKPIIVKK